MNRTPKWFAILLVCVTNLSYANPSGTMITRNGWQTHCIGRFLVDLPREAKIVQTYEVRNEEIKKARGFNIDNVTSYANKREAELRNQKHHSKGDMFIKRVDYQNGSILLLSWDEPNHEITWKHDTYLIASGSGDVFTHKGPVSIDRADAVIKGEQELSSNLRSRTSAEIPAGSGFCIEDGFIYGNTYMSESFDIGIELPSHPGASISFSGTTQREVEPSLFARTNGVSSALNGLQGMKTLRKRERDIGSMKAEEFLVAGTDNGQRLYAFAWEAPGKAKSLSEPNLSVELNVLGQNKVSAKQPYKPALPSDEDALELWDAIINSIRLRPGAV